MDSFRSGFGPGLGRCGGFLLHVASTNPDAFRPLITAGALRMDFWSGLTCLAEADEPSICNRKPVVASVRA